MEPRVVGLREPPARHAARAAFGGLLHMLHSEGIRYCFWRGREDLRETMIGKFPMDLLVDRQGAQPLARLLVDAGFKRFEGPFPAGRAAAESYCGLEPHTGALARLQLRYELILGDGEHSRYHLPWESIVLATRVLHEVEDVYVPEAHVEALLLVMRATLAPRPRGDPAVRRESSPARECEELLLPAHRILDERLIELASHLLGDEPARLISELSASWPPSPRWIADFRRCVASRMRECRMGGDVEAHGGWWNRARRHGRHGGMERHGPQRGSPKLTLRRAGILVAFVGVDGSGKSTVTREIANWLSASIETVTIYFGSGKGPASLARRALQLLGALRRSVVGLPWWPGWSAHQSGREAEPRWRGDSASALRRIGDAFWVLAIARERRRRVAQVRRARERGMIVLCDRFPQSQLPRFNEGAFVGHWRHHSSWLFRLAGEEERAAIQAAESEPPDLVVKLHVRPDLASRRRPTLPPEVVRSSVEMVRALRYPPSTRVIDVDANEPLRHVLRRVEQVIWELL